ncbi:hypothetical protein BWO91_17280 [Plantibacter flavus]|uniref:phage tail protein n=1 Tax=Plantibacter flavus TaxID=150123 RepID=UPI00099B881C|nr:phage tail length tape measure family protein [Plantibacter flavus]AQX81479.1 hypothetical protein BWO91_17280 [Plantibacter flavus]
MAGQTIVISVLADTQKLGKDMAGIGDKMGGLTKGLAGVGIAAGAALAGIGLAVGKVLKDSFAAVAEVERLNAQTSAALQSTGGAAQRSLEQINGLADSLEKLTGVEAETTQAGQNVLLTFTNIKGTTFDAATKSALDMSVALGKDMAGSATLVGKALNDPIAGIGALSKVGVQLTDDQKNLIKALVETGDVAGAQSVILGELNTQFGGSAEAFGNTFLGTWEKVKNSFGDLGERLVVGLLPAATLVLGKVNEFLQTIGDSPAFQKIIDGVNGFVTGLTSGGSPIADFVSKVVELVTTVSPLAIIFEALQPILPQLMSAFGELGAALSESLGTILPQLIPLASLLAESLAQVFVALLPLLAPLVELATTVVGLLIPVLEPLIGILTALLPPITDLITNGLGLMMPVFLIFIDIIKLVADLLAVALTGAVKAFGQVLSGDFQGALQTVSDGWTKTWDLVSSFFGDVVNTVKTHAAGMVSFFTEMASNITMTMVRFKTGVQTAISNVVSFFAGMPGAIMGAISGLLGSMASFGQNIISGLVGGISGMANAVINVIKRVIGDAISFAKKLLGIASPSKVFDKMGDWSMKGLARGLRRMQPVMDAMRAVSSAVSDAFTPDLSYSFAGTGPGEIPGDYGVGDGGRTYNIKVEAIAPNAEVGRAVVEAIDEFERQNGTDR